MYPGLHALLMRGDVSRSWRTRGRLIPTYEFEQFLSRGIAYSCAIVSSDSRIVGLVELFDLQQLDRHAQLAVAGSASLISTGLGMEALGLFIDECFVRFDLRKIYAHADESATARLQSGFGTWATVEGRLEEHLFVDGRYEDVTIIAISRSRFAECVRAVAQAPPGGWKVLAT